MKPEAKLWNDIRQPLRLMGHCDRIETGATALGRPDVNICVFRGPVWDIELKVWDKSKGVTMRPAQKHWHRARFRAGGNSCIITRYPLRNGTIHTFHLGHAAADLSPQLEDWTRSHYAMWGDKINFEHLREIFCEADTEERG